tara:strand:- start:32731 stop:33177 length:447 start_codon:yes stop_codon:yes gene_type:complete
MEINTFSDEYFMNEALKEAEKAFVNNEVPVGAIITCNGRIIARSYNSSEKLNDSTAHAEMLAFTSASSNLGGKYLDECVLYVTLEPCAMCAGAAYWTRISKIVYGASDEKKGFLINNLEILHPKTQIIGGVLKEKCKKILQEFFRRQR